jgi:hypothetical protein
LHSTMIRGEAPACRLKPTSTAIPTAAKQENNNNNEEERLGIHDVHSFSMRWLRLWLVHISAFGPDDRAEIAHIIWEMPTDKKEVGELDDQYVAEFLTATKAKPSACRARRKRIALREVSTI